MATGRAAKRGCVAAAHHGEHAVLGAGLAAGDRGIDKVQAQRSGLGVQLARHLGRGGGVVHEDGAGAMPAKAPSAPSVTERRSSSLPTQQNTMSAPCGASRGVACFGRARREFGHPFAALAAVRL
jgi:hypothetical protein